MPVMRADHQVAQKLHALSGEGSERARDLVDLQLLDKGEDLDLSQVARDLRCGSSTTDGSRLGRQRSSSANSGTPSM